MAPKKKETAKVAQVKKAEEPQPILTPVIEEKIVESE